ncbi:3' [Octopus vulgaris]|uniref:3&apos n=1 Tax=Octopus vulgaris TaxID=6645 RepID=A0AA36B2G5_OCTVU|nr:3' [Octopus vulgaris]
MNPEKCLGRSATVVLREGTYHGIISRLDSVSRRITLRDVCDPVSGRKYPGPRHFYVVEILEMKFDVDNEYPEEDATQSDTASFSYEEDEPNEFDTDEKSEEDEMTQTEKNHSNKDLAKSCDKFTIVESKNLKATLDFIQREHSIGLNIESSGEGRFGTIVWVTIAVKSHVYIFDFRTLEKKIFSLGLKAILEDLTITKFIHDCRFISDLLYNKYNVQLANVFDTQVADVFVHRIWHGCGHRDTWPKHVQNLAACLYGHLELSTEQISCIRIRQNRSKQEEDFWTQHPLSASLAERLYSSVVYIEELGHLLMNKMMVEYLACVDIYLGTTRDLNDSEALWTLNKREYLPKSFSDLHKFTHVIKESFKNKENRPVYFRQPKSCSCNSPTSDKITLQSSENFVNVKDMKCQKASKVFPSHHNKVCKNGEKSSSCKKLADSKGHSTLKHFLNDKESLKDCEDFLSKKERPYQKDFEYVKEQSSHNKHFENIKRTSVQETLCGKECCTCFKDFSKNKELSSYKEYEDCQQPSAQCNSFSSTMFKDHKETRHQSAHLKDYLKDKESPSHKNYMNTPDPPLHSKRFIKNKAISTSKNFTEESSDKELSDSSSDSKNTPVRNMDFTSLKNSKEPEEEDILVEAAQKIFQSDFTPGLRKFLELSSDSRSKLNCWRTEKESSSSNMEDSKYSSCDDHQETEKVNNKLDVDSSRVNWSLYKGDVHNYNNVNFYPAGCTIHPPKKGTNSTSGKKYRRS